MTVAVTICIFRPGARFIQGESVPMVINRLELEPTQAMCERLKKVGEFPVYEMQLHKDEGLQRITRDAYGQYMWGMSADTLQKAMVTTLTEHECQWWFAIRCFLRQLSLNSSIVLYWH